MKLRFEVYGVKYDNELIYVGKTQYGMPKRRSKHKYEAFTKLYGDPFHVFIREVGWDNLEWFVIEECESQEEITNKEKYYIKTLKPTLNKQEKAFYVYNLDGNFVGEFNNIYDTSKILNIEPRFISRCLNKDKNKSHGYIFTYENTDITQKIFNAKHPHLYAKKTWDEITSIYESFKNNKVSKTKLAIDFDIDRADVRNIINFFEGR